VLKKINFDNEEFYIDSNMPQWSNFVNGSSELTDSWEKLVSRTIINEIRPDWNFAEIGASFGAFTLLAAKRTNGYCYAFEPNNYNFSILSRNLSRFNNADCFNKAVGDENTSLSLNTVGDGLGGHSLVFKRGNRSETVDVVTLDSMDLHIDMMKIDVEGYGHKVLIGANKTLDNVKMVMFEWHKGEDGAHELLKSRGFKFSFYKYSNRKSFIAFKDGINYKQV
jgi:FkbM family methyltransferase